LAGRFPLKPKFKIWPTTFSSKERFEYLLDDYPLERNYNFKFFWPPAPDPYQIHDLKFVAIVKISL
jgi:hypothetical protein